MNPNKSFSAVSLTELPTRSAETHRLTSVGGRPRQPAIFDPLFIGWMKLLNSTVCLQPFSKNGLLGCSTTENHKLGQRQTRAHVGYITSHSRARDQYRRWPPPWIEMPHPLTTFALVLSRNCARPVHSLIQQNPVVYT